LKGELRKQKLLLDQSALAHPNHQRSGLIFFLVLQIKRHRVCLVQPLHIQLEQIRRVVSVRAFLRFSFELDLLDSVANIKRDLLHPLVLMNQRVEHRRGLYSITRRELIIVSVVFRLRRGYLDVFVVEHNGVCVALLHAPEYTAFVQGLLVVQILELVMRRADVPKGLPDIAVRPDPPCELALVLVLVVLHRSASLAVVQLRYRRHVLHY